MKSAVKLVDHPILEPEYRAELSFRVQRELTRCPARFQDLVQATEGAYPSDVLSVLYELQSDKEVGVFATRLVSQARDVEKSASTNGSKTPPDPSPSDDLPEPHPLDFDWRFSRRTLAELEKQVSLATEQRIAILGAPSFFTYLADRGVKAHLFDKNGHVIKHLKSLGYSSLTQCDLFKFPSVHPQFHCALADPPWYLEHYLAFISASRNLLVPEGRLLVSVLPRLTRPSAPNDRFQVVEAAASQGFDLTEVRPGELRYVSPPFEVEALRADGLTLGDWRSGDLFAFVLRSRPFRASKAEPPMNEEEWQTIQLGKTLIRIKQESRLATEPFDYQPVSPTGDIRLRSVSRRSPVRSKINVWSSRNIALNVSKTSVLADALQKIGHGDSLEATLASVAYQYQLDGDEVSRLGEILEVCMRDAGMTWNG